MKRCATWAVYLLYFTSGAAALIYEVSWTRQIGEILGHSSPSAGVVLAACFFGLAIGYGWGGRVAGRVRPLRAYALAEAAAAAWALMIPLLLSAARRPAVIAWLGSNLDPGPAAMQAALCLVLLLPATTALGATLPLIAEFFERRGRHEEDGAALIAAYSINTLGAVVGIAAATGVLFETVGVGATSCVGAGLSLICAIAAMVLSAMIEPLSVDRHDRRTAFRRAGDTALPVQNAGARLGAWSAVVGGAEVTAAVSGFVVLALEVLYMRLFSLVLHNSSYSFAAVLIVFLTGLAAGAMLVARLQRPGSPDRLATFSLGSGALCVTASVYVFTCWTGFGYLAAGQTLPGYLGAVSGIAAGVMLPPVVLLGMTLPALWRDATGSDQTLTARVGRLSAVNTLAAAAGALAASHLLLPVLGLWNSFALVAGLAAVTSAARVTARHRSLRTAPASLLPAGVVGLLVLAPPDVAATRDDEPAELLRRWETAYGWIDVVRDPKSGAMDIRQNLHYRYGSTGDDAVREQRQAHLPLLLHPRPHDVLFIGLGTGVTAAGATRHADVERITVVELIPEVVEAARWLGRGNQQVVDDPRVRVVTDDARHFLAATDEAFDVVVGDLFVPWESETGYLYTQEHFERIRSRLTPGGVCCQWLALYQVGPDEFRLIADTFAKVFPETTLWWGYLSARRPIVALVGAAGPLNWDAAQLSQRCERLQAALPTRDEPVSSSDRLLESLLGRWVADPAAPLNTVEHPRVEFSAPWSHQGGRLLKRGQLREFLDRDLSQLPPPSSVQGLKLPEDELARIRGIQRYVLFGE